MSIVYKVSPIREVVGCRNVIIFILLCIFAVSLSTSRNKLSAKAEEILSNETELTNYNSIYNYAHISYEKDYELSTNEMKTSVKEKLKHN